MNEKQESLLYYMQILFYSIVIISGILLFIYGPQIANYDSLIKQTILGQHPELQIYLVNTSIDSGMQCHPIGYYAINASQLFNLTQRTISPQTTHPNNTLLPNWSVEQ